MSMAGEPNGHGIVDLGARVRAAAMTPRFAAPVPGAIVRHLDEDGTHSDGKIFDVDAQGNPIGLPNRTAYLDGEQLIAEFRAVLRDELKAFAVRFGLAERDK